MKNNIRNISTKNSRSADVAVLDTKSGSFSKLADYAQLVKLNLTIIVVSTAVGAFLLASNLSVGLIEVLFLAIGGFFVTAASNALNQVLERDYDGLMKRTSQRPLVTGRMSVSEAVMAAGLFSLIGITFLAIFNPLCSLLGTIALVLYSFVYTPLKRYSSAAVFVGAIAGALPMMIGVVAYTGGLTLLAISLFMVQFFWQYPHFWAIGYKGFEDYERGGFRLIPATDDRLYPSPSIGKSAVFMTLAIFPVIGVLYYSGFANIMSSVTLLLMTLAFLYFAIRFNKEMSQKTALALLLSSIAYIPSVLIVLIIGIV